MTIFLDQVTKLVLSNNNNVSKFNRTQLYINQTLTTSMWGIDSSGVLLLAESLFAMLLYK